MVRRKEDRLLLIGRANFIDDLKPPNTLFASILRSPYAHAKVLTIDKRRAVELDGVIDVLDSHFIEGKYVDKSPRIGESMRRASVHPLATDKVRYVGEPVAVVLARDRYTAEDALELIDVKYEPLDPCVDPDIAMQDGPVIHEEWGSNIAVQYASSYGDVEGSFRKAEHVFRKEFSMHRHSGTPIETRGIVASYDQYRKELTVWATNQVPHIYRNYLATLLELDENLIRVISPNIGGSYGTKTLGYQEDLIIPLLSIALGVPVKWIETREESFRATNHGREGHHKIEVSVDKDGLILAVKDRIVINLGAYPDRGSVEVFNAVSFVPGCYKFQNYSFEAFAVVTNKTPLGPYRAYGKSSPCFAIERMMDIIARELKLDPAEVRRRNFVEHFPHRNPAGATYDSGDYLACLESALKLAQYNQLREFQIQQRKYERYIGIGISCGLAPSGGAAKGRDVSAFDSINIRVSREGKISVATGACGLTGVGHETTISQIVSEILGVNQEDVHVLEGDTALCPIGQGTYSDRSAVYTASAAKVASEMVKKKILTLAASFIGVPIDDLRISEGVVKSLSSGKSITFQSIARKSYTAPYDLPAGLEAGLDATYYFSLRAPEFFPGKNGSSYYPCFANDCNIAVVEVDRETGVVYFLKYYSVSDVGTIINRDIVEGQISGGMMAGLGGTLYEELSYDSEGNLLTSSFLDYLVPTAMQAPKELDSSFIESPSPITALGSKGAGESGAIGIYAAIANAVEDALRPFGAEVVNLPLKPEAVWTLLRNSSHQTR
jgi:CO/xanthine dehydrogenase Mo-binding subunit